MIVVVKYAAVFFQNKLTLKSYKSLISDSLGLHSHVDFSGPLYKLVPKIQVYS